MLTSDYKKLQVWDKSMQLAGEVYRLVRLLPDEERFALSDQMRRAAVSIPSNIAEGECRNSVKEFMHFLNVARGSVGELETQLLLCVNLRMFDMSCAQTGLGLCTEIGKMLRTLINTLKSTLPN